MLYRNTIFFALLFVAEFSLADPIIVSCNDACGDMDKMSERIAEQIFTKSIDADSEFAIFSPKNYTETSFRVRTRDTGYGTKIPFAESSTTHPDVAKSMRAINQIVTHHGTLSVTVESIKDISQVVEVRSRRDLEDSSQAIDFIALHLERLPEIENALISLKRDLAAHVRELSTVYMSVTVVLEDGSEWPFVAMLKSIGAKNTLRVVEA